MSEPDPAKDLRVLILNQFYVPDVASTGHLLSELAWYLACHGADVSVLTSMPSYGPKSTWQPAEKRETTPEGVRIRRMWTTRFPKDSLVGRTCNSMTFLGQMTLRVLFRRQKHEVFLYTTNPPYLGVIGGFVALFRKHPYVLLLHDSYPQLTVVIGAIKQGGFIERVWHRLNRFMYLRAEQTIVLCDAAKTLVCDTYGVDPERVQIVHNWADADKLRVKPKQQSEFAREHGLVEPFTVLYSGNLGLYYEYETILGAAELLKDANFRLVFVGAGGKRDWLEKQIKKRELHNTLLLPYQPFDKLPDSLSCCDASLVTIDKGIEGISYPSKLYSSLAMGRPVLAISEAGSELKRQVADHGAGYWFELGDAEGLAERIRKMEADPEDCKEKGRNARALFEREYTLEASAAKYARVLRMALPDEWAVTPESQAAGS